jgi:RNA polymerase sigma-70 factor (ECF subfamily)
MADKPLDTVFRYARKLASVQTTRDTSDHALLSQFVAGKDESAFTALMERHGPMVLGVCRRALQNAHDAEDASQATFLVLARRATRIRKTTSLGSWLHGVAARVSANLRREQSRRSRRERNKPPAASGGPADEVSWREVQAALDEELLRLPESLRATLVHCYLEGRTRDEAAQALGISVGCLHGRLERARKRLCDRLTRRGLVLSTTLLATALAEDAARAGLSPTLTLATVRAATPFASGQEPAANLVAARVIELTREVISSMVLSKRSVVTIAAILAGVFLAGATFATLGPAQDAKAPEKSQAKDGAAADDARALQGVWQAVWIESDGQKADSDEVGDFRMTFKGNELTIGHADGNGRTRKSTFKLDPTKSPKEIDILSLDGQEKDQTTPGIYALDKSRLRICMPRAVGPRPKDFTTRQGDGKLVLVLERVDPKAPARRPGDAAFREFRDIVRASEVAREGYWDGYAKAKTPEQRRQLEVAKRAKLDVMAERCLKLATSNPDRPVALYALWLAAGNAPDAKAGKNALALLKDGRVSRADPEEVFKAINMAGPYSAELPAMAPAVFECVKHRLDHRRAARLLTWVCSSYYRQNSKEIPPPFAEAAELIVTRFADSPDIYNLCECLGARYGSPAPWAKDYEKALRTILEKNRHRLVRVTAQLSLASIVKSAGESRQEEAVKLFEQVIKDFDGTDLSIASVEKECVRLARAELDEMAFRAVGKMAPEIEGVDLEGRPMKLSEYRGKVVLLSFWATTCFPCMKLIPHERELAARLDGKPFVLVGVNEDVDADAVKKAVQTHKITWRSFRNKRAKDAFITEDWKILGIPTLYLIDRTGIIRQRWIGAPPPEELNRAVDLLVEAAGKK